MTDRTTMMAALFAAATSSAQAQPPKAKPVTMLVCATPQDAMYRALAAALIKSGRTVETVASDSRRSIAPTATVLSFVEEQRSTTHIAGHLVWTGADGSMSRGETLRFEVSDAAMNDAMLGSYADALVHHAAIPD